MPAASRGEPQPFVDYENTFYHNNFTDNYFDVFWSDSSLNNWDNGYQYGGNYWD